MYAIAANSFNLFHVALYVYPSDFKWRLKLLSDGRFVNATVPQKTNYE